MVVISTQKQRSTRTISDCLRTVTHQADGWLFSWHGSAVRVIYPSFSSCLLHHFHLSDPCKQPIQCVERISEGELCDWLITLVHQYRERQVEVTVGFLKLSSFCNLNIQITITSFCPDTGNERWRSSVMRHLSLRVSVWCVRTLTFRWNIWMLESGCVNCYTFWWVGGKETDVKVICFSFLHMFVIREWSLPRSTHNN